MKITYLDQNHWIELSRAAYGRARFPETPRVLEALRQAQALGRVCFPLSYAHYIETGNRRDSDRRQRLAKFILELSGGMAIAPPSMVIPHEIEVALARCFPSRVIPAPFQLWGSGAAHAFALEWLPGADAMPSPLRAIIEENLRAIAAELSLLSGILQVGDPLDIWPVTSRTELQQFKASLELWAGARSRYSSEEDLEREIYTTNLSEIDCLLQELLTRHAISKEEFAQLGELRHQAFLEDMPWQKAEMHLKRQWAKNRDLKPKDSDLIDWGCLSLVVQYCDIVVTENQKADLFSRDARRFNTSATIITELCQLPELVA